MRRNLYQPKFLTLDVHQQQIMWTYLVEHVNMQHPIKTTNYSGTTCAYVGGGGVSELNRKLIMGEQKGGPCVHFEGKTPSDPFQHTVQDSGFKTRGITTHLNPIIFVMRKVTSYCVGWFYWVFKQSEAAKKHSTKVLADGAGQGKGIKLILGNWPANLRKWFTPVLWI